MKQVLLINIIQCLQIAQYYPVLMYFFTKTMGHPWKTRVNNDNRKHSTASVNIHLSTCFVLNSEVV